MKLTANDKLKIYELRQTGMKLKDIAILYNVGAPWVCGVVKEMEGSKAVLMKEKKQEEALNKIKENYLKQEEHEEAHLRQEKEHLKEKYRKLGMKV